MLIAYRGDRTGLIFDNDPAMMEGGNPLLDTPHLEDTCVYVPEGLDAGVYRVDEIKFGGDDESLEISGHWRRLTLIG